MLRNLAAVAANYRQAGIRMFVLAYFARNADEVQRIREALGLPLRVVRLTVPIAAAESAGVEDVAIGNDRPIGVVARNVMSFLGWL